MKVAFAPEYVLSVPDGHRFPMAKYELIPEQLVYEGTLNPDDFFCPQIDSRNMVKLIHEQHYLDALDDLSIPRKEHIKIGLPFNQNLVKREYLIVSGIIEATQYALKEEVALTIAGGTHHAFPDRGEGFCVFNDVAIAAKYLLTEEMARQVLIIDLDVHQGNGTAKCLETESRAFTFSMHAAHNYPLKKETSDLDVPLQENIKGNIYLSMLRYNLEQLSARLQPDFIFYNAGVDVLQSDHLGKLNLTKEDCKERDKLVFQLAKDLQVPIVAVMGGGYSPDIRDIVEAHCNTFRTAKAIFE